jgi:flagellar hook protein FlgE
MTQGVIESSERALDMAIQGDGFFIYNMNGRELYSRAGNISQDRDGNLIDTATGAFLRGYNVDKTTNGVIIKKCRWDKPYKCTKDNLVIPPILPLPRAKPKISAFLGT